MIRTMLTGIGAGLLLAAFPPTAAAQQDPAAGGSEPLTIADVYVRSAELPEGCRFAAGMPCASDHASAYFHKPSFKALMSGFEFPPDVAAEAEALFPVPVKKEWQSFEADGGVPGSVLLFEYEPEDIPKARVFFPPYLHGQDGPSDEHPEEVVYGTRLVMVISFPRGDPAAEWYKDRLRKKFRIPAPRERAEVQDLGIRLMDALQEHDVEAGLALIEENAAQLGSWAFGQFLVGVLRSAAGDWAGAEVAYARALELHDTLEDPLQGEFVWAALDSLGMALLEQGKAEAAIPVLRRAVKCGGEFALDGFVQSLYRLARACAREEQWGESLEALASAIECDPAHKQEASTDEAFAEARKRKEFQELLK